MENVRREYVKEILREILAKEGVQGKAAARILSNPDIVDLAMQSYEAITERTGRQ